MAIDWESLGGDASRILSRIFQTNPADAAMPFLQHTAQQLPQFYAPWMQAGLDQLPQYKTQIQKLLSNPGGFINDVGQNYRQSPGFQFQLNQGLQGANNAAAAGGMAGSPQAQQNSATVANNLANQDYYKYLTTALDQYGLGFKGSQDLIHGGQNASANLGEDLASLNASMAQNAYRGADNQNQSNGGLWDAIFSGISHLIPFL